MLFTANVQKMESQEEERETRKEGRVLIVLGRIKRRMCDKCVTLAQDIRRYR
jgi:hypothetical protein